MTITVAPGFSKARCRSCGAPILWARTIAGRALPFEGHTEPVAVRETTALDDDRAVLVIDTTQYPTHWERCPDAAKWRRGAAR